MKVVVINKKGGVGKTSLAFSLAKDLNMYLFSNDGSIINLAYPKMSKIQEEIEDYDNCIYDINYTMQLSARNINILCNNADVVVIPLTADLNSFKKTMSLIKELENKNIVLVANRSEKNDFEKIKSYFIENFDFPIFEIKSSRIWTRIFKEKKSILELVNNTKSNKHTDEEILKYTALLQHIKNTFVMPSLDVKDVDKNISIYSYMSASNPLFRKAFFLVHDKICHIDNGMIFESSRLCEIDHIFPKSKGDIIKKYSDFLPKDFTTPNCIVNYLPTHKKNNITKGNEIKNEWLQKINGNIEKAERVLEVYKLLLSTRTTPTSGEY